MRKKKTSPDEEAAEYCKRKEHTDGLEARYIDK